MVKGFILRASVLNMILLPSFLLGLSFDGLYRVCGNVSTVQKLRIMVDQGWFGNGPFAASGHMVHAGGQAAHLVIQNKENSNLS